MLRFHMTDIIPLLPIPHPPHGRSSYNIPCPDCDDPRTRHGHLNISLVKDVFRCPRCDFSGGVFDLYAKYANIPRDDVFNALKEKLSAPEYTPGRREQRKLELPPVIKEYPLADIEMRDATYRALLSRLSLASDHRDNLLSRGLSPEVIENGQYRTTPVVGEKAIAKQLHESGCYLSGVPGFYRDKDGQWTFIQSKRGILIPVRDWRGQIQGLQVRRDNVIKRKFRWVSSAERTDGCGAETWVHMAGPPREQILLIEGPLKADVVHHLTGQTVIAIPGVNALLHLMIALEEQKRLGAKKIMTCFDMDFLQNPYVQNGYMQMVWALHTAGFHFGTYLWRPDYNGLDDFVWEYCMCRQPGAALKSA